MKDERITKALKVQRAIETGDPTDLLKPCKCGHWMKMNGDACPVCGDYGFEKAWGTDTRGEPVLEKPAISDPDEAKFLNHRYIIRKKQVMISWK